MGGVVAPARARGRGGVGSAGRRRGRVPLRRVDGRGREALHNSEREEPQVGDRWLCEEELGQGETRTCGV
jgi:hypothetical protein